MEGWQQILALWAAASSRVVWAPFSFPSVRPVSWSLAGGFDRQVPQELVPYEDFFEPGVLEGFAARHVN